MPIALTKAEWARIARWTDPNKEDPDAIRRREYVRYLDETSRQMTKHWPNSLENVNKRNEELRRARIEAAEQTNTKFYKRYIQRKQEEQKRLMFSARDTVFKNKDAPKLLLSAVIETVIQKEREEQLKFNEELRRQAAEQKRREDDDIIRKAKEWHELMALRRKRRWDVNKQHQKEISEQAQEVADRNRKEYEIELSYQKIDNVKADQEMDALKKFQEEFNAAEKARIWADMTQSRHEADARKREQQTRELMDERLQQVLQKSRARVESRRKQTEEQIKREKQQMLEKISQKLQSGDAAREAKEQAILQKAVDEKEAVAEARRQAQADKLEKFKQERVDIRKQFLEKEEQRVREFNTMHQWEVMNRFKNAELYEDFQDKLRDEKLRKTQQYREDILKLWKEREDRDNAEIAARRRFYGVEAEQKLRDADNRLLSHAAELLQEAAAHQRPQHALERAVDRYCKLYRLYPMPELPAPLQRVFPRYGPRDCSRPDAGYEPPAPPAPSAPPAPAPAADKAKRDGLQDPEGKPGQPAEDAKPTGDYARAAPANGLQRRAD